MHSEYQWSDTQTSLRNKLAYQLPVEHFTMNAQLNISSYMCLQTIHKHMQRHTTHLSKEELFSERVS